jgi:AraC family transcriptional regulator
VGPGPLHHLRDHSLSARESVHLHGGDLAWLFLRLHDEFLQNDAASSLAMEAIVFEMLATIARKQNEVLERQSPRWLHQAREMLHAHFLDELNLSQVSHAVGVHPVHLCREFRRHYRVTVGQYVRKLRIEYASRKMLDPDITLAEIAAASGFADQSHFTRSFKRAVGVTPGIFRTNLMRR